MAAVVLLALTWGRDLPGAVVALVTLVLAGAVLSAAHHAEVVAHRAGEPFRVGEPFGSLVLAVAVSGRRPGRATPMQGGVPLVLFAA